ncbi:MAG: F0F1 ATP synthase subunit A [Caldilineaceae bacterium SB0662_bin_9]|uniref:ATP synthase subunit a n=1 Tax=Caldilineaceae bacterium SB0662_bin_9 TaxID=2605258 RepID=A0A6B1DRB5_9CHLR|nr:F0F1 ATP synthase subunit A [Caldilineaceae bacterium SB0666_bin_21]MYA04957.1 F0F1 ATP synthase subunit A [Caldilineaceae bacterium SB0664_bin_22]MYD90289.1 F0F1 ATP synthase subunit A [Caldilineaceae bacterium SB0662_bin_9]
MKNPKVLIPLLAALGLLVVSIFLPKPELHVSLAPEIVLYHGPSWFTNTYLTTIIVDIILIVGALVVRAGLRREVPKGFTNVMEAIIDFLRSNLVEGIAGKNTGRFFPFVATIFFLVIVSNYVGLIPGVNTIQSPWSAPAHDHALAGAEMVASEAGLANVTAAAEDGHVSTKPLLRAPSTDLNMTFALAILTMVMVQYFGFKDLGVRYLRKFFAFKKGGLGAVMGVVGLLELLSEFAKIVSFAFRLFGNIFAGEVLLAVMAFLIPFMVPSVFYGFEIFVGFIQAAVFMMLALIFFQSATVSHDDHH